MGSHISDLVTTIKEILLTNDGFAQLALGAFSSYDTAPAPVSKGMPLLLVMSPVQRSASGRRDHRFDICRRDPRFCLTPLRPAMFSILLHPQAFRCSRLGPAPAYIASLATVTGSVNTDRIRYLGCALRTARLNDDCRPHPTTVAASPHYPHTRPPDVHA